MNDSKRDVRLSKRNKSANAVLKQVSGSNLDGITNVNKQDEKVNRTCFIRFMFYYNII